MCVGIVLDMQIGALEIESMHYSSIIDREANSITALSVFKLTIAQQAAMRISKSPIKK
jgi:hypothetical protein